jgi:hypothetical protein
MQERNDTIDTDGKHARAYGAHVFVAGSQAE